MKRSMKYVYGPIPSRRLGQSLGISPIPKKACNYACVYCMLGPTDKMTNTPQMYMPVQDILEEFDQVLASGIPFDMVTFAGDGEPTLYAGLKELILELKKRTKKPIVLITNGALLYDPDVYDTCMKADIVMPSVNGYDERSFKLVNRPHGDIDFEKVTKALKKFSREYPGLLWLELMLMKGINDSTEDLHKYNDFLGQFYYDRLYINTPNRPPVESFAQMVTHEKMLEAMNILNGIGIEDGFENGYASEITDDLEAILNITQRHPMNQHEIEHFLKKRKNNNIAGIFMLLRSHPKIKIIHYRGIDTYRIK